jgi:hypothetical protein
LTFAIKKAAPVGKIVNIEGETMDYPDPAHCRRLENGSERLKPEMNR